MKRMQDKSKISNIHDKAPTPPQTKANHKLPQTKPYEWQTPISELKRVVTKIRGFSIQETILPLKPKRITSYPSNQSKSNQAPNSTKTSTPPEAENTRFHQLSLDTPQDKHMPLNQ
jgi:hypothetical protein